MLNHDASSATDPIRITMNALNASARSKVPEVIGPSLRTRAASTPPPTTRSPEVTTEIHPTHGRQPTIAAATAGMSGTSTTSNSI